MLVEGGNYNYGGRPHPEIVSARVKAGAPMPYELRTVIPEEVFYNMRKECINARSFGEFQGVIARYTSMYHWNGAVTGHQEEVGGLEFMTMQVLTLGGLVGGAPDAGAHRVLFFHMPTLHTHAQPSPSYTFVDGAQVISGIPSFPPASGESVPIAYAANGRSNDGA
jgi:hypothetical protein